MLGVAMPPERNLRRAQSFPAPLCQSFPGRLGAGNCLLVADLLSQRNWRGNTIKSLATGTQRSTGTGLRMPIDG